ncbi:MAG TPA: TraR/DksA C4-type zinc finger protein [Actinomycetota bacterium]|jgi:DnaK suppressor protein|nr:TraR/DksA C4-type zinc finger protein [Actinomycetota bacterium]
MSEDTQVRQTAPARSDSDGAPDAVPSVDGYVMPFDAKALKEIKKALLGQRAELLDQLQTEAQAFSSSESEIASDIRSDENPAEAGTATFEREKHLSIANNVQDLLEKSSKALDKIAQGSYGICEVCGKPISPERLKALPHALMCIECKKAEERR